MYLPRLPFKYDPDAKCPRWIQFLEEVLPDDEDTRELLRQWTGYLFRPDLDEQKFLLMVGEGANGKGVFCEVVQALVGDQNCSQVPIARFKNAFALYTMLGKTVNVTNESSHIIEDDAEAILKSLVAGDRFTFERKFKEPVCAVPTAKIMVSTNALPRFNNKTLGIWRRILLVQFDRTIPEELQNKRLADELKQELPGIFNWAIEGLYRLNIAGGFTVSEKSRILLEEYRRDSDPARAFLIDCYMYSPNAVGTPSKDVYEAYRQWCDENGCKPMNSQTFGSHVRRTSPGVKRKRIGPRDGREYHYSGLVSQVSQVSQGILS